MREIVHIQAGQCGNQIGAKVRHFRTSNIHENDVYNLLTNDSWGVVKFFPLGLFREKVCHL